MPVKKSRRTVAKGGRRSPARKSAKPKRKGITNSQLNAFAEAIKRSKQGGQDVEGTKDTTKGRRGGL